MEKRKNERRLLHRTIVPLVLILILFPFITKSPAAESEEHQHHITHEGVELHLSDDLKELLNQEMNKIEEGMKELITAISAGSWKEIADIAKNIKDSFILQQKLSKQQIEELHHSLPKEFIEMDQQFHSTAGKLAHAAQQQDGELVNFYFSNLNSQCMKCHSEYASKRFPNFQKNQQDKKHQH